MKRYPTPGLSSIEKGLMNIVQLDLAAAPCDGMETGFLFQWERAKHNSERACGHDISVFEPASYSLAKVSTSSLALLNTGRQGHAWR